MRSWPIRALVVSMLVSGCGAAVDSAEPAMGPCEAELPDVITWRNGPGDAPGEAEARETRRRADTFREVDTNKAPPGLAAAIEEFIAASDAHAGELDDADSSEDPLRIFIEDERYAVAIDTLRDELAMSCD